MGAADNINPTAAPDGGWGWVVVFVSFMIHFWGPGTLLSLGVLYVSWIEEFHSSRGKTSWPISLACAVFLIIGPLVSSVAARFGYKATVVVGSMLFSAGFCLSFFASDVTSLIIYIGIIAGCGCGFCYLPAIATVAEYFEKRRSLALGIATSGSGIGSFVQAPIYNWLIMNYGWRGCLLLAGALPLNMCALALLLRPLKRTVSSTTTTVESREALLPAKQHNMSDALPETTTPASSDNPKHSGISAHCENVPLITYSCLDKEMITLNDGDKYSLANSRVHISRAIGDDIADFALQEVPRGVVRAADDIQEKRKCSVMPNMKGWSNSDLNRTLVSGSLGHLAYPQSKVLRPCLSVSELHHRNTAQSNSLKVSTTHLTLDLLMMGSIHSLSMIGTPTSKLNEPMEHTNHEYHAAFSDNSNKATDFSTSHRQSETRLKSSLTFVLSFFEKFGLLRKPEFLLFIVSNALTNLSYFMPVMFLVDRAMAVGIDRTSATMILSVCGVGNVVGRLLCGAIGDRNLLDRTVFYFLVLCVCGAATSFSPLCGKNVGLHVAYAFLFGLTSGAYTTLVPVVTVDIVGVSMVSQAYGVVLIFSGIPGAFGSPLAGLVYDWTGDFTASFVLHGFFILMSAVVMVPLVWLRRKKT